MGQGLKAAPFTYSQFGDLVFGPLPKNAAGTPRMPTVLGRSENHAFQIFMDDHAGSVRDFEAIFDFLMNQIFSESKFWTHLLVRPKDKSIHEQP